MLYQGKSPVDEGPQSLTPQPPPTENIVAMAPTQWVPLWAAAWTSWLRVGEESTAPPLVGSGQAADEDVYVPSQAFLAALVQTLPSLLPHAPLHSQPGQLQRLLRVLHQAVGVPSHDYPPFQMLASDSALSPLQDAVINTLTSLQNVSCTQEEMHLKDIFVT